MSRFIKVTEIRRERYGNAIGSTYIDTRTPRLINVDYIVSAEDNIIHFADFKIRVAETLEQIHEQLLEITGDNAH